MPGVAQTGPTANLTPEELAAFGKRIAAELGTAGQTFAFKTRPQVAATAVWAATVADGDAIGGNYCQDVQGAPVDNTPGIRFGGMSPQSPDQSVVISPLCPSGASTARRASSRGGSAWVKA